MLDNLTIGLLQEALMITLRDKYAMPVHFKEFGEKYELIKETYELLEDMRTPPNF